MKNYNVLLIMTDQQRWDTLGCYGNSEIETPNLDWLASQGTLFMNAYTPSPSCIPARASLLTGMDPWNTGILGMGKSQGSHTGGFEHTLPGELTQAGYHTQGVGKMHFYPQRSLNGFHHTVLDESGRRLDPGFISDFQKWFDRNKSSDYGFTDHGMSWNSWMARPTHLPEYLHPTYWTINESISFLKDRDPGKPFFLKTSFARPHSPYDAPPYYFDLYMKKDLPKPFVGDWASMHDVPEDAADPDAWRGVRKDEEIHRARAGYYGSINFIDHQIGRLFDHLKRSKQFDNTLVIFTSDHGDMMGDHHLWRKTYAYEGSSHVPMIIKLPKDLGKPIRKKVEQPVILQDIMPTILDVAGVKIPETVDGTSMKRLMLEASVPWREYVHGEHSTCYSEEQEMQFLTDGKYKYIWLPRLGVEQLFNLIDDPGECVDLSKNDKSMHDLIKWRSRLVSILEQRKLGLTDDGTLICQAGEDPMVSPKYKERLQRIDSSIKEK